MFLDTVKAQRYLDRALARGGDFAELFEEVKWTCSVSMLNGKIEAANSGERWGLSIRIFDGLRTVYGYTNEQDDEKIMAVIDQRPQTAGGVPASSAAGNRGSACTGNSGSKRDPKAAPPVNAARQRCPFKL